MPVVADSKPNKVLIDGGSGLNVHFTKTLKKMKLDITHMLTKSTSPFYGIVPGNAAIPLGSVVLPVTFVETRDNYRTEYIKGPPDRQVFMTTNEIPGPSGTVHDRYLEDISADELSANAPADKSDANRDARRERNRKRNERRRRLCESLPIRNLAEALDQVESRVHTTLEECLMSITTIARQAQGMRAGEVIAKLAEDAYFMRVDNKVTQVALVRKRQQENEATSHNRTRGELPANPNRTRQKPVGPPMVATAPAAIGRSSLTMILAAEVVMAGAQTIGLVGEPGAKATAAAEATRTAMPPELHVTVSTPARRSTNFGAKSPPQQATTMASRLLCTASQPTSPGEIQASGDHQVRREAGSSAVAQMLRPLYQERWWQ
jgi:hypothetical protein